MVQRDDPFLAWLGTLHQHRLSRLQTEVVLTALIDRLRHTPAADREEIHRYFCRYWNTTVLTGGWALREIGNSVRRPRRGPGRPAGVRPEVRAQYLRLLDWAESLRATNPTLTEFRRALAQLHPRTLIAKPLPLATVPRLYRRLDQHPERLAFEILRFDTGKAVKTLRAYLRPPAPPKPAVSAS
jgi:hypothetical protein